MVLDFWHPLSFDILKRRIRYNRKADKKDVGLWVGQRSQTVVVLLPSGIPESKVDGLAIDHHVRAVVVENSRDVLSGERVGGVGNEEARFTDGSISHYDA